MNFVNSVLFTAEKNTISDVKKRIPSLQMEVNEYKLSIDKYFQDIYNKHLLEPKRNVQLEKLQLLLHEVNNMHNQVEEITSRNFSTIDNELIELRDNVIAADFSMQQVNSVINIHEFFSKIEKALARKDFVEAVQELHNLMKLVKTLSQTSKLLCLKQLLYKASGINEDVTSSLSEIINKTILFNTCRLDDNVTSTITVVESVGNLHDVFKACYIQSINADINIDYLDNLTKFLWTEIIIPIICSQTELELSPRYIKISYNPDTAEKEFYKCIFDKLGRLFQHLNDILDYNLDDNCTVIQCVGADIRDNLSELLIKQCLVDTIPTTPEGLAQYNQVITDTETFQKRLVELDIFSTDTRSIIDHAKNIDVHFINKKCNTFMTDALNIMKEDLHDTIEVGGGPDSTHNFPKCCVSKSVLKLLELGEKILDWATKTTEISAEILFATVQKIFGRYPSEIKLSHSALLDTIPQQVAIFCNNCMYMAHIISDLKAKYVIKLGSMIRSVDFEQFSSICKTLIDSGTNSFDNCIKEQVKLATETLKTAELHSLKTNDNLNFESMEKAVRQCLRQQELLKKVWQKILPTKDYNNALGVILDANCNIILVAILSAEDINSTNAEHLVDVLKLVLTRGPKLFLPNTNICEFVNNWNKLSGLVFILHASMIDICEKWTNRTTSDLFRDFKATEIRQLIKAIFQNSDRRANILTKIQD